MESAAESYADRFRENLTALRDQFGMLLIRHESRDPEVVREAEAAYVALVTEGAENNLEALTFAWQRQTELGPLWADDPRALREDLGLSVSPEWEVAELYLVAGLVFCRVAVGLHDKGAEGIHAAAMLYGDARDALETWTRLRGFAGCRNPNTKLGEVAHTVAEWGKRATRKEARSETARSGGKARAARTQAVKDKARALWNDRDERTRLYLWTVERFATEVSERWGMTTGTVRKWCTEFEKENQRVRGC